MQATEEDAALETRARKLIDAHALISFDVFDTLILRRLPKPVDVFALVRLRLLDLADCEDASIVDDFPAARVRAEYVAREDAPEATLDQIYAAFARESDAPAALVDALKATELAVERDVVYANPIGKRLVDYARDAGKTVVFCSDMYLPSMEIARLLDICGYDVREPIYVSCEAGGNKHLGTLYPIVLSRQATDGAHALHIGDNAYGDVAMARAAGISALHLALEPAAIGTLLDVDGDERHRVTHAIVEGIIEKRLRESTMPEDPFERLGFCAYGPLFAGFSIWLAAKIRERRPDKVLFIARDTFFVRQYLAKFLAAPIDENYVFASRGSLLLASFTDFPVSRLVHLFSGKKRLSVARHLRRLGLRAGRVGSVIRSVGFDGPDDLVDNGDPRMVALLAKLHRELLHVASERRPLARRYLAQCVGEAKRVFVVDVGWIGTIQASIARLLQVERPDLVLEGHYVCALAQPGENASRKHTMSGWLSAGATEWERRAWWSGGVELLEFAMTAPHGTTVGYAEGANGEVVPALEADLDIAELEHVRRLQAGVAGFIEQLVATYGDMLHSLDSRAWAERFFHLVTAPARDDAALLGDITHGDVAGDASVRLRLAARVEGDLTFDAYEQSFWKAGFITRNALRERTGYDEALYLAKHADVRAAFDAGDIASGLEHYRSNGAIEHRIATWAEIAREHDREP